MLCLQTTDTGREAVRCFLTDKTGLVGPCHSRCSYGLYRYNYNWFHMCPSDYLSSEQVSFLMYFFPRLYSLPGGEKPNREPRWSLAVFLRYFPIAKVSKRTPSNLDDNHHRAGASGRRDSVNNNIIEPSGIVWKAVRKPQYSLPRYANHCKLCPNLFFYA